jgi:hypothetical protein
MLEHQIVILRVGGSGPLDYPKNSLLGREFQRCYEILKDKTSTKTSTKKKQL